MYTMRDVSDAELTSRVQHLVPWVQDVLDQARERQTHLDTLRQQRDAARTASDAPASAASHAIGTPADLAARIQQACSRPWPPSRPPAPRRQRPHANGREAPGQGTRADTRQGTAPPRRHDGAAQQCEGRLVQPLAGQRKTLLQRQGAIQPCGGRASSAPPEEETTMLRMDRSPYSRLWAIWDDQDLVAVVVDKKGAPSFCGGSRLPAPPSASAGAAARAAPPLRASSRAPARTPGVTPPGPGITRAKLAVACPWTRRTYGVYSPAEGPPEAPTEAPLPGKGRGQLC